QATGSLKFFDWAYANGDTMAAELEYVALPDTLKTQIRKLCGEVKDASGKPVALK
ncbi:MAG: phosphate transporter substrate-binding protein PstS, partial [Pseudomonadota bacterium]